MTKTQWLIIGGLASAVLIVFVCIVFQFVSMLSSTSPQAREVPTVFVPVPIHQPTAFLPLPTIDVRATETLIAQNVFATQTASVPTRTSTPVATLTPQATPTPTCDLETYERQVHTFVDRFAEAEKRITSVYIIPNSNVVSDAVVEMNNISKDFAKLQPPECALTVYETQLDSMNAAIEAGIQTFNEGLSQTARQKWDVASSKAMLALRELDKLHARINAQDNRPPTTAPTELPAAAKRISFARGGISATVQDTTRAVDVDHWVLAALGGQTMSVNLIVQPGGRAVLVIYGTDGTALISGHASAMQWSGLLPKTQDYFIDVKPETGVVSYTLQVTIPPR